MGVGYRRVVRFLPRGTGGRQLPRCPNDAESELPFLSRACALLVCSIKIDKCFKQFEI